MLKDYYKFGRMVQADMSFKEFSIFLLGWPLFSGSEPFAQFW